MFIPLTVFFPPCPSFFTLPKRLHHLKSNSDLLLISNRSTLPDTSPHPQSVSVTLLDVSRGESGFRNPGSRRLDFILPECVRGSPVHATRRQRSVRNKRERKVLVPDKSSNFTDTPTKERKIRLSEREGSDLRRD